MKIYVAKLPPGGVRLQASEPGKIIDIKDDDVLFDKPIEVDVFAQLAGSTLIVKGTLSARPRLRCSRCLEYYEQPLIRPEYMFSTAVREKDIIDLTESIREDTIIALPIKPLCSVGCKGLCQRCGANLNEGACGCGDSEPGL